MRDAFTFGLAYAAYLMLCGQVLWHLRQRGPRWLSLLLACTAAAHVALVWHGRFEWSLGYAWSKNPAAFVVFHAALALVIAGAVLPYRWSRASILIAFPVVTFGALGAVWRNDAVVGYRWPVAGASGLTFIGAMWLLARRVR